MTLAYGESARPYGAGTWQPAPAEAAPRLRWRPVAAKPQAGPHVVQGQRASDLEARVYAALVALGWTDDEINFQYGILGGSWRAPGSQIIDFLIEGWGRRVALAINGDYWHSRTAQMRQQTRELEAKAREALGGKIEFYGLGSGDLLDDEQAYRVLLRLVGRGPAL